MRYDVVDRDSVKILPERFPSEFTSIGSIIFETVLLFSREKKTSGKIQVYYEIIQKMSKQRDKKKRKKRQ